tara:strand:- start:1155 stop:2492 length:1338 start_codon:yes stop_codon:yes gene_type:complete
MKLPVPYQITVNEFFKEFANKVIRCKKFNRRSCWDLVNQLAWRASLRMGWCINPLIYIDIQSCIDYCVGKGLKDDVKYFQKYIDDGFKYLTVEGGNRHDETVEFYKDETEKLFRDNKMVNIAIVEDIDRKEMHDLYVALAGGKPPKPQERRTGIYGVVSDLVRNTSQKLASIWEVLSVNLSRMEDDETIAILMSYCTTGSFGGVNGKGKDKVLDTMYTTNEYGKSKFKYLWNELQKIFNSFVEYSEEHITKKLGKTVSYLLTLVLLDMEGRYKIDDYDKFVKYFYTLYKQKVEDSKVVFVTGKKNLSFSELMNGFSYKPQLNHQIKLVNTDFIPFLEKHKAISLTNKESFNQEHKTNYIQKNKFEIDGIEYIKVRANSDDKSLVTLDDKTVPEVWITIPLVEAYNGDKYELDHIIPKVDNGPTDLSNAELTTRTYNRKKSKKHIK